MSPSSSGPRARRRPQLTVSALEDRSVPADITGSVFGDLNADGIRDVGESGSAGVVVFVDANRNGALDGSEVSTLTAADGSYSFDVVAGNHYIAVVAPSGTTQTGAGSVNGPGSGVLGEGRIGFPGLRSGVNPDGTQNYSGIAWSGEDMYVSYEGSTQVVDDTVMFRMDPATGLALSGGILIPNGIGDITFDGINFWGADHANDRLIEFSGSGAPGRTYQTGRDVNSVEWVAGSLWVTDNVGKTLYQVNPDSGVVGTSLALPSASIGGLAFDGRHFWVNNRDTDRVFEVNPVGGAVLRSFAAPGDFAYGMGFDGQFLWLSDNRLGAIVQYDIGAIAPARGVTVAEGELVSDVNLGLASLGSVSGRVFEDTNSGGISGWRVYLDTNNNDRFDNWEKNVVTGVNGGYAIGSIRPGSFELAGDLAAAFSALPRWSQTSPAAGYHSIVVPGAAQVDLDFGYHLNRTDPIAATEWGDGGGGRLNLYTGLVWLNESLAASSQHTWDGANIAAANSTRNGYLDWRLPTKDESVSAAAVQLAGQQPFLTSALPIFGSREYWTSTAGPKVGGKSTHWLVRLDDPSGPSTYYKDTNIGVAVTVRDTGTWVDDGASGYADTGWTAKTGTAYGGDYRQKAAGTGSHTATWTFAGLEPGATYKVATSWPALSTNASNAPYTVLDNANAIGTVALNQKVAPNDFSVGGQNWEGLGIFTTASATLKVRLSNQANGTVVADAVRIFRVYPGFEDGGSLRAANGPVSGTDAPPLTKTQLQPIVREAIRRWNQTGLTSAERKLLRTVEFKIADLDGATLGFASGNTITLDDNAAGYGWFVDRSPRSDSEFRMKNDQGEQGKMDLLTAVMHELGHVLGKDHDEVGAMAETLATGTRESIVPGVQIGVKVTATARSAPSWFLSSGRSRR